MERWEMNLIALLGTTMLIVGSVLMGVVFSGLALVLLIIVISGILLLMWHDEVKKSTLEGTSHE